MIQTTKRSRPSCTKSFCSQKWVAWYLLDGLHHTKAPWDSLIWSSFRLMVLVKPISISIHDCSVQLSYAPFQTSRISRRRWIKWRIDVERISLGLKISNYQPKLAFSWRLSTTTLKFYLAAYPSPWRIFSALALSAYIRPFDFVHEGPHLHCTWTLFSHFIFYFKSFTPWNNFPSREHCDACVVDVLVLVWFGVRLWIWSSLVETSNWDGNEHTLTEGNIRR